MVLTDAESQHLSCCLKFWWHQLTDMTVEPVEEMSVGARRVLPDSAKVTRSSLRAHPARRGSACTHRAFLWEGLLHRGGTWLPEGLGGLWHCYWYPKQLRENLDCSCYSHTSCGHCGGRKMEQLSLTCPSWAAVLHHSTFKCTSQFSNFSNGWETGTAGRANYCNFKEQHYVWKAILFLISKKKKKKRIS